MRPVLLLAVLIAFQAARAAEPGCGQALVDGATPPATTAFITPPRPISPFYQWENNDGYCGEVSMMEAGLANGQYMSQFQARLVCGTGLSQTGPDGACKTYKVPNYNAQLLIEDPGTGVTGPNTYANAALCVANSRLAGSTFPYLQQGTGLAGYQAYMSWVKQQVILGHQVTLAVLINGGTDPQYDHEVGVIRIGTNHAVMDPTYYDDDVVYFDDHGAYTLEGKDWGMSPSVPPGAGADKKGCTPYIYGYTFGSLPNTRKGANKNSAQAYSIIIPGDGTIQSYAGGSGYAPVTVVGPRNYAFSVAGPADVAGETLPVSLAIVAPTKTRGVDNPRDPVAGWNYENPKIGVNNDGGGCSNARPLPMTDLRLRATVSGLVAGESYNLYEYDSPGVSGVGTAAALPVPVANFNANAALASHVTRFLATGATYTAKVTTRSDLIVVFRCVPASGP